MVPSDYRLPSVATGLITRLEGTRRSYAHDPGAATEEYTRVADQHVDAALAELDELGMSDDPGHGDFLRDEIHKTFLPRYSRLAAAMNDREAANFGLGPLGDPLGRAGLALVALLGMVMFIRLIYLPWAWPLFLLDLSLPLWPDIARVLVRRRYQSDLQQLIDDLQAVQVQATAFAPLAVEPAQSTSPRPRTSESQ